MSDSQTPSDDTTDSIEREPTGDTDQAYEPTPEDWEPEFDPSDAKPSDDWVLKYIPERDVRMSLKEVTKKDMQRYRDVYGDERQADAEDIQNDVAAAALRDHYENYFDGMTGEDIAESKPGYYDPLLKAIAPYLFDDEGN